MRAHSLRGHFQIAVIGGNGFLGRAIVHRLSSYPNLRIFSIDKRIHGVMIDTSRSKAIIQQIDCDVGNEGAIHSWLMAHPVDAIIYCAGVENPTDGLSLTTAADTKALLGLSYTLSSIQDMNIEQDEPRPYFLYVSSWSVYGNTKKPAKPGQKEYPHNAAGMNKLLAEDLVRRNCSKLEVPYCILRPTEIYGRRHTRELRPAFWPGFLAYYVDKIVRREKEIKLFSPNTKVDLVNINHFSKFVVNCIENRREGVFNVASGQSISIRELFERILLIYGEDFQTEVKSSSALRIEDMNLDVRDSLSLVPYDFEKYDLDSFITDYIKIRRLELGKDLAIQDALSEPVILDSSALQAREGHNARQARRKISYARIKEVAGPEFFNIRIGSIQERTDELSKIEFDKKAIEEATAEQAMNNARLELIGLPPPSTTSAQKPKVKRKRKK